MLLVCLPAQAKEVFEKKKNFNHHVSNLADDVVCRLTNKFGDIRISTWEKSSIKIDVEVTVRHNKESKAVEELDRVNVDFTSNAHLVEAETQFYGDKKLNSFRTRDGNHVAGTQTEINYTVYIPLEAALKLSNKFGDVIINGSSGKLDLSVSYGALIMDKLVHPQSKVKLLFSKRSTVSSVDKGTFDLQYSSLTVNKANTMRIYSKFSELELEKTDSLVFKSEYDKVNVVEVRSLMLDAKFSTVRIDRLQKRLNLTNRYGSFKLNAVESEFELVHVDNEFAKVKIGFASGASLDINATTKYADFEYPGSWNLNVDKDRGEGRYTGTVNGGRNKIRVTTQYGNVHLYTN